MTGHVLRLTLAAALCGATLAGCGQDREPDRSVAKPSTAAAQPNPQTAEPPQAATAKQPAAAQPLAANARAEVGQPAPDFTLTDTEGKSHTLSSFKGKTVVLEWFNPDCPFVKYSHQKGPLVTMARELMGDSLVWLAINSNAPGKQGHGVERNRDAKRDYAMAYPILLDESGKVGRAYGAEKTPHMFVIDAKGMLLYRGAIDNAPIGKVDPERPRLPGSKQQELVNYVRAALEDMRAQRALRLPETPAYGCTVKYQS